MKKNREILEWMKIALEVLIAERKRQKRGSQPWLNWSQEVRKARDLVTTFESMVQHDRQEAQQAQENLAVENETGSVAMAKNG